MADDNAMTADQDDAMTKTKPSAAKTSLSTTVRDKLGEHADALRTQASETAHEYAVQGKDKATELLDGLVELVDGAVGSLNRNFGDTDLGASAGDYAKRAAEALSGFTDTIREKDVEELFDNAKAAIRNNPAIAIGAAAAIGFVLARLVKSGGDETEA